VPTEINALCLPVCRCSLPAPLFLSCIVLTLLLNVSHSLLCISLRYVLIFLFYIYHCISTPSLSAFSYVHFFRLPLVLIYSFLSLPIRRTKCQLLFVTYRYETENSVLQSYRLISPNGHVATLHCNVIRTELHIVTDVLRALLSNGSVNRPMRSAPRPLLSDGSVNTIQQ
jgi:hypothetical protein